MAPREMTNEEPSWEDGCPSWVGMRSEWGSGVMGAGVSGDWSEGIVWRKAVNSALTFHHIVYGKLPAPWLKKFTATARLLGLMGYTRTIVPPPPQFSQRFMKRHAQGCSLQPHANTEIGSIAEAPYLGTKQHLLIAFLPKYKASC